MSSILFLTFILTLSQPFLLLSAPQSLPAGRQPKSNTLPATIAAAPATLPDPPFQELSPDIAPLLPSSGGVVGSPTESTLPTIPSNPSPPKPEDELVGPLDSAMAPFGALSGSSSAVRINLKVLESLSLVLLMLLVLVV